MISQTYFDIVGQ